MATTPPLPLFTVNPTTRRQSVKVWKGFEPKSPSDSNLDSFQSLLLRIYPLLWENSKIMELCLSVWMKALLHKIGKKKKKPGGEKAKALNLTHKFNLSREPFLNAILTFPVEATSDTALRFTSRAKGVDDMITFVYVSIHNSWYVCKLIGRWFVVFQSYITGATSFCSLMFWNNTRPTRAAERQSYCEGMSAVQLFWRESSWKTTCTEQRTQRRNNSCHPNSARARL